MAPVSIGSGEVKTFHGKRLQRWTVRVICHAYSLIEEIKAGRMRDSSIVHRAKCYVTVTWEVLQGFLCIAMIFANSIPNVWRMIDKLVTQGLQP